MSEQPTLFDGLPLGKGPERQSADSGGERHVPVFWRTEPGFWVVFYWAISPKQGIWFEGWQFPVFWCADSYWWASTNRVIPEHVLFWASETDAGFDFYRNYSKGKPVRPGREYWPSRDNRRRRRKGVRRGLG